MNSTASRVERSETRMAGHRPFGSFGLGRPSGVCQKGLAIGRYEAKRSNSRRLARRVSEANQP